MDRLACDQGKKQILACEEYEICFNTTWNQAFDVQQLLCESYLSDATAEYYAVLRIECLIKALGARDDLKRYQINQCIEKNLKDYESEGTLWMFQEVNITYCSGNWTPPVHYGLPNLQCDIAKNPREDENISGTQAYIDTWYEGNTYTGQTLSRRIQKPQDCVSECCTECINSPTARFQPSQAEVGPLGWQSTRNQLRESWAFDGETEKALSAEELARYKAISESSQEAREDELNRTGAYRNATRLHDNIANANASQLTDAAQRQLGPAGNTLVD